MVNFKGIVRRTRGSTSGFIAHYLSAHISDNLNQLYLEKRDYVESKREEICQKRKWSDVSMDGTQLKQLHLVPSRSNDLALDIKVDHNFQKEWDKELNKFIGRTQCSLSLVSSPAFRDLIGFLQKRSRYSRLPGFKLKSRRQVTDDMSASVRSIREKIIIISRHFSQQAPCVNVTSDIWSDRNGNSYLSITIQLLTKDFHLINLVPFVTHFTGRHTGINIALTVDRMMEVLGLKDVKKYASHDNAGNIVLAFDIADGFVSFNCLLHTMQLGIKDSFKSRMITAAGNGFDIKALLKKCQELVVKVKKSPLLCEELGKACKEVGVKRTKMIKSQKTRWDSTYTSLVSIFKLKAALVHLFNEEFVADAWSEHQIFGYEWRVIAGMITVLGKVQSVTKKLQGDKTCNSNLVIPKLFEMQNSLTNFIAGAENDR